MAYTLSGLDLSTTTAIIYNSESILKLMKNGTRLWERFDVATNLPPQWVTSGYASSDIYPTNFTDTSNHFVLWGPSSPTYGLDAAGGGYTYYSYDLGDPFGFNTGVTGADGGGGFVGGWLNVSAPATITTHEHGTITVGPWRASLKHPLAGQNIWVDTSNWDSTITWGYYYAPDGTY